MSPFSLSLIPILSLAITASKPSDHAFTILSWSMILVCTYWYTLVAEHVQDPYLDEVFHARQAIAYSNGQWEVWDPKITTPPGLYLSAYLPLAIHSWLKAKPPPVQYARVVNYFGLQAIAACLYLILLDRFPSRGSRTQASATSRSPHRCVRLAHTAFNITLFPPLFFFCGLFYTDVLSVLMVLGTYIANNARRPFLVVLCGLASLMFRQTNVFWVAIYLAGKEIFRICEKQRTKPWERSGLHDILRSSVERRLVYDPPVREAWIQDYFKCALSLGFSAIANIRKLMLPLLPYLTILGAFGAFVLWNGGVVLGDRENHIATMHVAQMLYIWPYISFFSFPVLLPTILSHLLALVPEDLTSKLPAALKPRRIQHNSLPQLFTVIFMIVIALAVIFSNTMVHPFTLADNRHYTFYVFKILMRHKLTKYLLAPLYIAFAWTTINALGALTLKLQIAATERAGKIPNDSALKSTEEQDCEDEVRVSFVILWMITSAFSLASTPLVEPRYFILPWMIWRLNVPISNVATCIEEDHERSNKVESAELAQRWWERLVAELASSWPLYLETLWLSTINIVTGYLFLYRGFSWPSEPEAVQRFMW